MERSKVQFAIDGIVGIDSVSGVSRDFLIDTIIDLCDDERILTEAKLEAVAPIRKAKEIALDAAVKISSGSTTSDELVDMADEIYKWLISE